MAGGGAEQATSPAPATPAVTQEAVPAGSDGIMVTPASAVAQPNALALTAASEHALAELPDRAPVEVPADDLAEPTGKAIAPAAPAEPPAMAEDAASPAPLAKVPETAATRRAAGDETPEQADPEEPFALAALRLIAEQFATMMSHLDGVRAGDVEAVHGMRVASRRLRAALDAVEPISKPKAFRRLYRAVKELTGALGGVRDGDVLLAGLRKRLERAPAAERAGLAMLCARIEREQMTHRTALRAFLDRWEERDVAGAFARFTRQGEPAADGDADKPTAEEEANGEGR